MKIAPIDIAHKEFAKKMMGYDQNEVIDFLRDVADQMEEIIRERNALREAVQDKEAQLVEARSRDEALKGAIATATKMTEQIRKDAEMQAQLILQDAQQKADLIVKDSRESLRRIYQDIAEMKRARMQFEAGIRSLVQSHISMLDQGHNLMPEFQQMPNIRSAANLSFQEDSADVFQATKGLKSHGGAGTKIE